LNSVPIELPEAYRQNLRRLAYYLSEFHETPSCRFDMTEFDEDRNRHFSGGPVLDCGSVGCAIGHGPYAGITKRSNESWFDYTTRVFLPWSNEYKLSSIAWGWCFSEAWAGTDNSPGGAAARISWLLKYGVPDDANEQRNREAPLCYVTEAACQPN